MAEAPALNETLTPDDAVDVFEEVLPAQNKSYELGLKLKLSQHAVEAIHSRQLPPDKCLLKILIKFVQQVEPRPTWRIIVEALKSPAVNLPALARRVEAAHFPDTMATSDVVAETPVTEHAASTNGDDDEVKSKIPSQLSPTTGTAEEVQRHAVNLPPLPKRVEVAHFPHATATNDVVAETTVTEPVANTGDDEVKSKIPSQLSSTTGTVEAVQAEIKGLHRRFNSLKEITIHGLERCRIAIMTVVYTLTTILTVQEHKEFLVKNQKSLNESSNHWELFGTLNCYWNYLSYDLLEHLVKELALKHECFQMVAGEMVVYKKDLEEFRRCTTLMLFCEADPRTLEKDPSSDFTKMVGKFDWPETTTLEHVEKFRKRYASNYNLHTCAMMLCSIWTGSFTLTWFVRGDIQEEESSGCLHRVWCHKTSDKQFNSNCVYKTTSPGTVTTTSTNHGSGSTHITAIKSKTPGQASASESEEDYQFVEQLLDDFLCPVTMGLLLQPHLTSCCGKHLSQEAATRIKMEGGACPMCKKENWTTVLNKHYQRQVWSLKVFCHHKNRGCTWEGEMVAFCYHINSCPKRNAPLMTEPEHVETVSGATYCQTTTNGASGQIATKSLTNRGIPKRSGVAGLYVDDSYIYYSCTEEYEDETKDYTVQKCKHDGTIVKSFSCYGFVRGIGQDNDGNIYILCSRADPCVIKLNRNFVFLKTTKAKCAEHFSEAKGMIVTSKFVLVAVDKFDQICVFDLQLNFKYILKLRSIRNPTAISTFQNRYLVTGKGSIGIIDIDFQNKKVKDEIVFNSIHCNDKIVDFDPDIMLRGICAIDNYIYVTQRNISGKENVRGLPIMCLQFESQRLNYVCEDSKITRHCTEKCTEKCGSIVIFRHNETIFYTQGSYGELFHIVKATHNPGKPIESTKMFDVC